MRATASVLALGLSALLASTQALHAGQSQDGAATPVPTPQDFTPAPPPSPPPTTKKPKPGAFPFKPWSYARAYTFNFFADQPVQRRAFASEGTWSRHMRSEQPIADAKAQRAADLVAVTRGTVEMTKCTFPRHAIVYFDKGGAPVASADVCFDCEAVLAWPDYERPESFNTARMGAKFEKTLPLWRRLFEKEFGLAIDYKKAVTP